STHSGQWIKANERSDEPGAAVAIRCFRAQMGLKVVVGIQQNKTSRVVSSVFPVTGDAAVSQQSSDSDACRRLLTPCLLIICQVIDRDLAHSRSIAQDVIILVVSLAACARANPVEQGQ